MKIKTKLLITNVSVFLLFSITFTLFYLSADKLLKLKDLQKETMHLRNLVLELEYANEAILNARHISVDEIRLIYSEIHDIFFKLVKNPSLRYLGESTENRIQLIYQYEQSKDFSDYIDSIQKELPLINPHLNGETIETIFQYNNEFSPEYQDDFIRMISALRIKVSSFIYWYHPFSDRFFFVTEEILKVVTQQIRVIVIQTTTALFICLFFSITAIFLVYRNMIRKIQSVRLGISLISRGDLKTRIDVHSNDELSQMGERFNYLTETIWQKLNTIGSIIQNIGQSLSQNPDREHLEKTVLKLAIDNTQADSGAFYRIDQEKRQLEKAHEQGRYALPYNESLYKETIPFGKTILGITALSGEPYFIKNTAGQNLIPVLSIFDKNYISSCIILPLITEKKIIGIICLEKNNDQDSFRDMDFVNILSFIEFSAVTLANMEKYVELLHTAGLNREMQIASDIQKSLLPPKIPKVPGFDICTHTYSVKGISGDIYDFFPVNRDQWLFCMAEVSEKGIASSMVLVILRTLIRILVKPGQDPADLLNSILNHFYETTGLRTPLRINLCQMEPKEKKLLYCGTESQNMLLYRPETEQMLLLETKKENGLYQSIQTSLQNMDTFVFMTEGFSHARNEIGETYGWQPVMKILKKYHTKPAGWLQEAVVKDLTFFERHIEQSHDRTIFIGSYKEETL